MNNTNDYLTKCPCGRTTSKAYARTHEGKCKMCSDTEPLHKENPPQPDDYRPRQP